MKKLLFLFAALMLSAGLVQAQESPEPNTLPTPASNQIIYRSSDHQKITLNNAEEFGATYMDDQSVYYADADYGVITFDGNVTTIANRAFTNRSALTTIVWPSSVTSIGVSAFQGCAGMEELILPSTVTAIGEDAFNGWQNLKKLTVKAGSIGARAFGGCSNLSSIDLQEGVTSIGESAFSATKISAVTIPASVTSIETSAFNGCENLATLTFAPNSQLKTIGKEAFKGTALSGKLDNLPASLESIGEGAFYATAITSFTIPASLKSIGASAFTMCDSLKTLIFPPDTHLQKIGNWAFDVTGIEGELTIPASVTTIGAAAFGRCSLTKVYMSTAKEELHNMYPALFPDSTVIVVSLQLYEAYKEHFGACNKVEVPLQECQEYALSQIDAARLTVNTLSDEDNAALAAGISTIEHATAFDEILESYYNALALIDRQKEFEEKVKDVLAQWCTRQKGPAVEIVGADGRTIRFYNIKHVRYIKENKK